MKRENSKWLQAEGCKIVDWLADGNEKPAEG
jgi:hypothetical protein